MRRRNIPLLLILLIAFGLRVWGLADHNIWWDEGISAWAARQPIAETIIWTAQDVHPPLYYLLLRAWWLVAGNGEFALRFLSVIGGVLGVALAYRLGQAIGGRKAGELASLLTALSRFAIGWSQEIRMYAWATALATAALWAALQLWRNGGWKPWATYVVAIAGALLNIYLTASVPVITNLAFPLAWLRQGRPRRMLLSWVSAQLAAVALFLPWIAYALPRMHTWSSSEPIAPSFFLHLYATTLAVGIPVNIAAYTPLTVIVGVFLTLGVIALTRRPKTPSQAGGFAMLLLGLILPALLVYLIALPSNPIYARPLVPRYLLPLSPCFYVLLAWGLSQLGQKRRWLAMLGTVLSVAVAVSGLVDLYPGRARRDDYHSLTATLEAHRHPEDSVVLHTDRDWPIFAAHYPGDYRGVPYGADMDATSAGWLLAPMWEEAQGIWLILTPDAQRIDPDNAIQGWLEGNATAWETWTFGENILTLFTSTPERTESIIDLAPDARVPHNIQVGLGTSTSLSGASIPLPRYLTGDTLHLALYWDQPPDEEFRIEMTGPTTESAVISPPRPARDGTTRQQIDLPLPASLSGGRYRVYLHQGANTVPLGQFTLVPRRLSGTTTDAQMTYPLGIQLGDSITLAGYDLEQTSIRPGDPLDLTLYWQASETLDERYKVFVQLLGDTYNPASGNFLWGQLDNEPVNWQTPTTLWVPGTIIADPYLLPTSPDAPPGTYTLIVGMYGLVDGDRLLTIDRDGTPLGDAITLTQIDIQPR